MHKIDFFSMCILMNRKKFPRALDLNLLKFKSLFTKLHSHAVP